MAEARAAIALIRTQHFALREGDLLVLILKSNDESSIHGETISLYSHAPYIDHYDPLPRNVSISNNGPTKRRHACAIYEHSLELSWSPRGIAAIPCASRFLAHPQRFTIPRTVMFASFHLRN